MIEPVWVKKNVVLKIHEITIQEKGGSKGIRDEGLLDSALARPINFYTYRSPSLPQLASCYISSIVLNHPFIDGNKRTGFITGCIFLGSNNLNLAIDENEGETFIAGLAAREISEEEFLGWIIKNTRKCK